MTERELCEVNMLTTGENLREQLLEKALRDTGNEAKLDEINEIIDFFGNWNWCAKMLPDSETFLRTVFDFRRSLMIQFYAGKKVDLPIKSNKDE